jgi:hypothetical protein
VRVLKEGSPPVDQAEVQALFRKFAVPLAGYGATSAARKELAEMLARTLWKAMIAGPETEEEIQKVLKSTRRLGDDSLQTIQQLYFDQMRPLVSDEQLAGLRERLRDRRKER